MGIRIQPRDIEVHENDPFKHDLLDRREAVDTLTHLVGNLEGPCVLAVEAAWGFGKTTFLKMWTQHLRNQGFPVIEFNAWETDFSEDPFVTLSSELTEGLQQWGNKLPGNIIEKLKDASVNVLRILAPSTIRIAALHVPFVGQEFGRVAASFAEKRLSQHSEARTSVEGFRCVLQDMSTALSEANENRSLIVAIDELDRCRPSYAVELLEIAKHLFSVDHVVFVMAVNCDQLAHSVRALYGNNFDAEGYLHRFFDLDFQLPEPSREAFIHAQLQATGIDDYFDQAPDYKACSYEVYRQNEIEREQWGKMLRTMLLKFFGASELSLRTVGQAIHRMGLLYASLHSNQRDYALATTVALILRTLDQKLYDRFVSGEISDRDVVDAVFGHPGLKPLQHEKWNAEFETAIILAAHEDKIPNMSPSEKFSSPLLDRYNNWDHTSRELPKDGTSEDETKLADAMHAERVVSAVEQATLWGPKPIGFAQAVQRLELFSTTLINEQPNPSATKS